MNQVVIPQLSTMSTNALATPAFAAYKEEMKLSFVRQYDPRVQSIEGFRHAVIRYRNTDKKTVEKAAQMVTIPQLKLPEEYSLIASEVQKLVCAMFEDEQDAIIRSKLDQGVSNIGWDDLELPRLVESLTAVRISNRLSKEQIEAWFMVAAKEVITVRANQISDAKQHNEEQRKLQVAGTMNAYKEIACKLAAPVPNIGQEQATALKNLFVVAKLADDMSKVLLAKLEQILNPKIVESGDL